MTASALLSRPLPTLTVTGSGGAMRQWQPHSYEKISILGDYLGQFAKASQRAYNRVYIDAFADDTVNVLKGLDQTFPGSAQLALGVSPAFTHVRLFDKNARRARSLRDLSPPPGSSFEVVEGDSNAEMARVLAALPVQAPTFAFLDPDGMELHWSTMRRIADHKRAYAEANQKSKVEMWVLFSTGGIVRILGKNRKDAETRRFPEMVARLYGAWGPWQSVWEARLDGRITPGDAKQAESRPAYEDLHTGWRDDFPIPLREWVELAEDGS